MERAVFIPVQLTDEVKRLNRDIERLESHVADVDKRVVRLETLVEISKIPRLPED